MLIVLALASFMSPALALPALGSATGGDSSTGHITGPDPNALSSSPSPLAVDALLDQDGDGCTDVLERGINPTAGGMRDPANFWDFMDVWTGLPLVRDHAVTIGDIGAVVTRFGSFRQPPPSEEQALAEALTPPPPAPAYHADFDRGGAMPGQDVWNLLPPNGNINIADIGAAVGQFGHVCISIQGPIVKTYIERSQLVRIACLDVNNDGSVDIADADPQELVDITGDGAVDGADLEVIQGTDISLPGGKPAACASGQPIPDWQISPPAAVDCMAGERAVLVLGAAGGGFDPNNGLDGTSIAVGIRWMQVNIEEALDSQGIPAQLASLTPGLGSAGQPALDAEAWARTYLAAELARTPCLEVVMIGHSYGAMLVKAVAERLEEAGLSDRILLTILVDPIPFLYQGTVVAMPQVSPVFNVYQTNDTFFPHWHPVDQPNVENWNASGEFAPKDGDRGGPLMPVIHTTMDNAQGVSDRINSEVIDRS